MRVDHFNRKYNYLGGWAEVQRQRNIGKTWKEVAEYFHVSEPHLVRLNSQFSMDSLSGGRNEPV